MNSEKRQSALEQKINMQHCSEQIQPENKQWLVKTKIPGVLQSQSPAIGRVDTTFQLEVSKPLLHSQTASCRNIDAYSAPDSYNAQGDTPH